MYIVRENLLRIGSKFMLMGMLSCLTLLLDPLGLAWGVSLTTQFLVVLFFWIGALLYLIAGISLPIIKHTISIFLLLLFSFLGSSYYIIFEGGELSTSFLRFSIPITVYPCLFLLFSVNKENEWFNKKLLQLSLLFSILIATMLYLWGMGIEVVYALHIFHEEVFILGATALSLFKVKKMNFYKWLLLSYILISCVAIVKLTGIIVVLVSFFALFILFQRSLSFYNESMRVHARGILYSILLLFIFILFYSYINYSYLLPSGSADIRTFTYKIRLNQFLENPILGLLFVGSTELSVDFFKMVIPSHSDILDIMAFGGGLGMCLFLYPVVTLLLFSLKNLALGFTLYHSMLVFLAIIVMLFNPVINQPLMAMLFWSALAYLACVEWKVKTNRANINERA